MKKFALASLASLFLLSSTQYSSTQASPEFFDLWQNATLQSAEQTRQVEERLKELYAEPHRAYHNINHIKDCLYQFEQFQSSPLHANLSKDELEDVKIALWFHDVIYNPQEKNNEEESGNLFLELSRGMSQERRDRIYSLILATKEHQAFNSLASIVLDIDLSILGRNPSDFDRYDKQIRSEYSWVQETAYRDGRTRILNSFLIRDRIFKTDYFHQKFEPQARLNLSSTIQRLTTVLISKPR